MNGSEMVPGQMRIGNKQQAATSECLMQNNLPIRFKRLKDGMNRAFKPLQIFRGFSVWIIITSLTKKLAL